MLLKYTKFNYLQVIPGSPAHGELMRGDIITKIKDYDARDLTHLDAQNMFKTSVSSIPIVVRRYIVVDLIAYSFQPLLTRHITENTFLSCYTRTAIVEMQR